MGARAALSDQHRCCERLRVGGGWRSGPQIVGRDCGWSPAQHHSRRVEAVRLECCRDGRTAVAPELADLWHSIGHHYCTRQVPWHDDDRIARSPFLPPVCTRASCMRRRPASSSDRCTGLALREVADLPVSPAGLSAFFLESIFIDLEHPKRQSTQLIHRCRAGYGLSAFASASAQMERR